MLFIIIRRTIFYSTLAKLLFMDEQPLRFKAFVAPLTTVRAGLAAFRVRVEVKRGIFGFRVWVGLSSQGLPGPPHHGAHRYL